MALYVRSDHVLVEGSSTKRSFTAPGGTAGDEEGGAEDWAGRPGGFTARQVKPQALNHAPRRGMNHRFLVCRLRTSARAPGCALSPES